MSEQFDRRECLRRGAAGLVAGAALGTGALKLSAAEESSKPVRIGVVGVGPRGQYLLSTMIGNIPGVVIPAICDLEPERVQQGIDIVKKIQGTTPVGYCKGEFEYRKMFERDDLDGILVATGVQVLARIAIDAMKAGKHVATEVTGAHTLDDCWGIVEEKERSGKHHMLLEQCCYGEVNLMLLNMLRHGLLGEPYYAECSYVHDCRSLNFNEDQTLTWRGHMLADGHGSSYGPHGLASVAKWMGINDGDRFTYCNAMMTPAREMHARAVEQFGPDSKAAKIAFATGDFVSTLIHTAQGKMIRLDYSITNTRPYSRYYLLQGMNGCYDSRSGLYVRGTSPEEQWDPADSFLAKYGHPYWRADGATARGTGGHDGMDFFCLRDFVKMVRDDQEPWVDCYDTASFNAINRCSELSIDRQGAAVEIPDFTKGKWQDTEWRKGRPSPASMLPV